MAVIRTTTFEKCSPAPAAAIAEIPGSSPASSTFTDAFLACYAKLWSKIADPVAAALIAANDYDQFEDAKEQISNGSQTPTQTQVDEIIKQLDQIGLQRPAAFTEVWKSALKLLTFGETVNNALAPDKRDKVKQAIDSLVKAL